MNDYVLTRVAAWRASKGFTPEICALIPCQGAPANLAAAKTLSDAADKLEAQTVREVVADMEALGLHPSSCVAETLQRDLVDEMRLWASMARPV